MPLNVESQVCATAYFRQVAPDKLGLYFFQNKSLGWNSYPLSGLVVLFGDKYGFPSASCHTQAIYGCGLGLEDMSTSPALKVPAKNGFSYSDVPFSKLSSKVSKYGYSSCISLK